MQTQSKQFILSLMFVVFGLLFCTPGACQISDTVSDNMNAEETKDSLMQALDYLDVVPPQLEERETIAHPWVFIIAVVVLLLVGLIRTIALQQHALSLRTAFTNISNQFEQIDKEASVNSIVFLQVLVSAIIIALGLFVLQPITPLLHVGHGFTYFLLLLLLVCLVYTVKYCIHFLVGVVLQSDDLAKLMVIGMSGMLYAFTLLVFPLIVVWYYVPVVQIKSAVALILLVLLLVFVIWRLIKSATIYYRYFPFAKIYIIIYLCALEITPILIIGKLVILDV